MRKSLIAVIVFASVFSRVGAQTDTTEGESSIAALKKVTVELTGTPFAPAKIFSPTEIRFRYLVNDVYAVRLGMWFDMESNQQEPHTIYDRSYFSVRPGVAYHLIKPTSKFSPYLALDFVLSGESFRKNTSYYVPIEGAWNIDEIRAQNYSNRSYLNLGGCFSTGFDYYVYKKVFVGMEVGFEYSSKAYSEVNYGKDKIIDKTTHSSFRTVLGNAIRIGYRF